MKTATHLRSAYHALAKQIYDNPEALSLTQRLECQRMFMAGAVTMHSKLMELPEHGDNLTPEQEATAMQFATELVHEMQAYNATVGTTSELWEE